LFQVLAHTELELHHEHNLLKREMGLKELGKVNRGLLEEQSAVEVKLLNEIALLTNRLKEQDESHSHEIERKTQQHKDALADWERIHKSEMLLKNAQIAKLQEHIRVLKGGTPSAKTGLLSFIPSQNT
jgi:flagellar motility protein MotE (MotC chaperone)